MMHGMIAIKNRKGRKRKSGRRTASGRLIPDKTDFKGFVAAQPHRNWLPESMAGHERAESILGCLNLMWRIHEAQNENARLSKKPTEPNPWISETQYEAGRRFSVIVGAFRQVIGAPRGTAGGGRGYACNPSICLKNENKCICDIRTDNYKQACSYLQSAGQKAYNITYQVVISEIIPEPSQMADLTQGLAALERGFGLGKR
jgi:hypothetical protein